MTLGRIRSIRLSRCCDYAFALLLALTCATFTRGEERKSRTFRIDYGATLKDLPSGAQVRVWLPVPPTSDDQKVMPLEAKLPAEAQLNNEPEYGNKILYFETKATSGEMSFNVPYHVTRQEVKALIDDMPKKVDDEQLRRFLQSDRKVPLSGKPLDLIKDLKLPKESLALGRLLYDRVDEHVKYDKSKPGYGRGDVLWVCDSRFGNCTDFHSLFISLARSQGIPARFEIGFSIPGERGKGPIAGYHCWAFFHNEEHGWVPVDISEADKHPDMKEYYFGNLTEDRIMFSSGRDITLVPKQAGEPLNFFIYPYVEVDGKPREMPQLTLNVTYEDEAK